VLLIGAAHLMLPIALSHAVLSVGILSGIAIVAIAAHVGLLLTLMRSPIVFLAAIVLGIALNRTWPLRFVPPTLWPLGAVLVVGAVSLFLLSFLEFRAAGTSVRGHKPTTTIVRTGPYRFSRNPVLCENPAEGGSLARLPCRRRRRKVSPQESQPSVTALSVLKT